MESAWGKTKERVKILFSVGQVVTYDALNSLLEPDDSPGTVVPSASFPFFSISCVAPLVVARFLGA